MTGLLRDLAESESHTDFAVQVANALIPGMYALLVDLTEHRPSAVDVRMRGRAVLHLHRARRSAKLRAEADALTVEGCSKGECDRSSIDCGDLADSAMRLSLAIMSEIRPTMAFTWPDMAMSWTQ